MGVVDFDPEKWSRANGLDAVPDVAKVAKLAEVGGSNRLLSQLSQVSQAVALPPEVVAGLRSLQSMAAPRLIRPERWPVVVADALTLARGGWVEKALALGWSPADLFGAVTERDGCADADGLAVWLVGRPLLALCDTFASVAHHEGRAYFNRCNRLGGTLLWEIGR